MGVHYTEKLEPEAEHAASPEHAAMVSMAISLKRIADLMEGSQERIGGIDALAMIADRMPSTY